MTFETLMSIMENSKKVKLRDLIYVIEILYSDAKETEESIDYYTKIKELTDLALSQDMFEGSQNDYHNIAVVFAREDEYDIACKFLEKGLHNYSYATDLLADFLNYGMQCDRVSQCKDMFQKLSDVKSKWNWRSYQFSIDYLMDCADMESDNIAECDLSDILELIDEFIEKIPNREESYLTKANFYDRFPLTDNSIENFLSVLEFVVSAESSVQRTPKCDLRLADYYYDLGENIEKANLLIERCKKNSLQVQSSVSRTYVYLLSSLCKMMLYYNSNDNSVELTQLQESLINKAYIDFHIASLNRNDPRVKTCKSLIETFVRETKTPYPFDDGIENDF